MSIEFADKEVPGNGATQPFLLSTGTWIPVKDANPTALAIFHRHYSYRPYLDGRRPLHFVGPGQKMVLLTPDARALFVWRKFISGDGQQGVNCAVFRNEGASRSSDLILEASALAWERWPGQRLYTYINPRKIRSTNPGCCFLKAGWRRCGVTKWNKLLILECVSAAPLFNAETGDPSHRMTDAELRVLKAQDEARELALGGAL